MILTILYMIDEFECVCVCLRVTVCGAASFFMPIRCLCVSGFGSGSVCSSEQLNEWEWSSAMCAYTQRIALVCGMRVIFPRACIYNATFDGANKKRLRQTNEYLCSSNTAQPQFRSQFLLFARNRCVVVAHF